MHFVGDAGDGSFTNMRFDPFLTGLSMLIATAPSCLRYGWLALKTAPAPFTTGRAMMDGHQRNALYRHGAYLFPLSSGIARGLPLLSLHIALLASCAAPASRSACARRGNRCRPRRKQAPGGINGDAAIALGMHYAGMKAAHFPKLADGARGVDSNWLSVLRSAWSR